MARPSKVAEGNTADKSVAPVSIDIQIERWPIGRLIPRVNNPRTHSREQIANIAASIEAFGWTNPVLVDGDDGILAGHARVLAARKLGMKEVPVIVLRHLSSAQRRALVICRQPIGHCRRRLGRRDASQRTGDSARRGLQP
jgi:hypothetical protein